MDGYYHIRYQFRASFWIPKMTEDNFSQNADFDENQDSCQENIKFKTLDSIC